MGRVTAVKAIVGITVLMSGVSLLGPVYKLPEVYLFGAFVLYFCIYVGASFCIVYTMKVSLKHKRKNAEGDGLLPCLRRLVGEKLNMLATFQRSTRYDVRLAVVCRETERRLEFRGTILNISSDGFMACLPQLDNLLDRVVVKVTLPVDDQSHILELQAEHLWFTEEGKKHYHGFRFLDLGGEQEETMSNYLIQLHKN